MAFPDILRLTKRWQLVRRGPGQATKVRRTEPETTDTASPLRRWLAIAAVGVLVWLTASLCVTYRPARPPFLYFPGQVVEHNVYSQVPFEYDDADQTERRREQARRQEPPVYRLDRDALESSVKDLAAVCEALKARAPKPGGDPPAREEAASAVVARGEELLKEVAAERVADLEYLSASREKWRLLDRLVADELNRGVAGDEDIELLFDSVPGIDRIWVLDEADQQARRTASPLNQLLTPTRAARRVAEDFVQRFPENSAAGYEALLALLPGILAPDLVYDSKATEEARQRAVQQVPVVRKVVPAGVALLRRGAKVTEEDVVRLRQHQDELYAQRQVGRTAADLALAFALCLAIVAGAAFALHMLNPEIARQPSMVILIGIILVLQMLASRIVDNVFSMKLGAAVCLVPALPLTLGALLLSPLVGLATAVWAGVFTSLVAAVAAGMTLQIIVVGALSSMVGAALMSRARKRFHAFRTGIGVSLTVLVVDTLLLLLLDMPPEVYPRVAGFALLNGVACATLASTILPFFEYVFGMTTEVSLLELNDLNHPLLKRLQLEAPGTYHHSLMVATVAEQAAEAIGANPLLARVCACFHDIGKLAHPEYFVENTEGYNPHDELHPRMSTLVIMNHVKEGIDLALKYKLKRPIREAIAQHHGTNLVYFFYRRALEQTGSEESHVGEQDFRYPGPLPRRKEIVLISLADACEAAARSLEKPSPAKISALVDEIVIKRIRDHQLEDADLTFAELALAKDRIAKTLGTMLHARIKYPREEDEDEIDLFKAAARPAARKPDSDAQGDPPGHEAQRT